MIGHTGARYIPLSKAIAASSAFPVAFPPLILHPQPGDKFIGGKLAASTNRGDLVKAIRLTDGGVYDNLGLDRSGKTMSSCFVQTAASHSPSPLGLVNGHSRASIGRVDYRQPSVGDPEVLAHRIV